MSKPQLRITAPAKRDGTTAERRPLSTVEQVMAIYHDLKRASLFEQSAPRVAATVTPAVGAKTNVEQILDARRPAPPPPALGAKPEQTKLAALSVPTDRAATQPRVAASVPAPVSLFDRLLRRNK